MVVIDLGTTFRFLWFLFGLIKTLSVTAPADLGGLAEGLGSFSVWPGGCMLMTSINCLSSTLHTLIRSTTRQFTVINNLLCLFQTAYLHCFFVSLFTCTFFSLYCYRLFYLVKLRQIHDYSILFYSMLIISTFWLLVWIIHSNSKKFLLTEKREHEK